MDFALTTILLVFLLLPGLIFRRFYYTEEFSKEYFKESIPNFFLSTVLPSTVINIICWQWVRNTYDFDTQTLGILFSGTDDSKDIATAFTRVNARIVEIIQYFIFLSVTAAILGVLSKLIVRRTKLDRKVKLFRFQNEWHYIFSGEILDFPRVAGKASRIDCTYVDALVDTAEGSIIYKGVLQEYILSKDGGIDRIYLTDVKRRYLRNDAPKPKEEYELPGQFFIIPFDKVLNLHLTYYSVEYTRSFESELAEFIKKVNSNPHMGVELGIDREDLEEYSEDLKDED